MSNSGLRLLSAAACQSGTPLKGPGSVLADLDLSADRQRLAQAWLEFSVHRIRLDSERIQRLTEEAAGGRREHDVEDLRVGCDLLGEFHHGDIGLSKASWQQPHGVRVEEPLGQ